MRIDFFFQLDSGELWRAGKKKKHSVEVRQHSGGDLGNWAEVRRRIEKFRRRPESSWTDAVDARRVWIKVR